MPQATPELRARWADDWTAIAQLGKNFDCQRGMLIAKPGYIATPDDLSALDYLFQECARNREITDEAFDAIYVHADDLLRDALDLATATGMRVRDVLALRLSDVRSGKLLFQASKTGKKAEFDLSASSILPAIVERRKLNKTAEHVFMLVNGKKPVTERMLHDRFVKARTLAAEQCPECGDLTLRDMRKRAAQLAGDLQEASNLLQHSSPAVTRKHYAQGQKVRPVR